MKCVKLWSLWGFDRCCVWNEIYNILSNRLSSYFNQQLLLMILVIHLYLLNLPTILFFVEGSWRIYLMVVISHKDWSPGYHLLQNWLLLIFLYGRPNKNYSCVFRFLCIAQIPIYAHSCHVLDEKWHQQLKL